MNKQDIKSANYWQDSYQLKSTPNLWGADYVPFVDHAITHFEAIPGRQHFLDLPCGDGRNLSRLCKSLPTVIGADYSHNALEIAKERLKADKLMNSLLHTCDVFKTNYLDDQFDGVFCWDLLGHLVNVEDALNELLRILKPKGKLIGSLFTTNDSTISDPKMVQTGESEFLYDSKFYFKYYDFDSANSLLNKLGATTLYLDKTSWEEGPHEGYREYVHEHESWAFVLQK